MKEIEEQNSHPRWQRRFGSALTKVRAAAKGLKSRSGSTAKEENGSGLQPQVNPVLKVAGYSLILMDPDGQVVWTREWDSGGVFEFGPRHRLYVFCEYSNHSEREAEIAEYEIELMGEDGAVIERFGESFGDAIVVPPGESKHFPAEWRL